jgi:hypothetical protein
MARVSDPHCFWKLWIRIPTRIRVKIWIQIHIRVKIQKPSRPKMESWMFKMKVQIGGLEGL